MHMSKKNTDVESITVNIYVNILLNFVLAL